jgi:hypothetical protein
MPPTKKTDSFAKHIVDIAIEQWKFFGRQAYDLLGHATTVGHKEGEPTYYQKVGEYWRDGVDRADLDGLDHGWPWSAAFISWVMREGGAGDKFRYSSQHSVYVSKAIRDHLQGAKAVAYHGVRLNEQKPESGDLVCWTREDGVDYDNQKKGDYPGHADIVIAVQTKTIDVIGGNVGNSVTRRILALDSAGFLAPTVQRGETLFGLMKNLLG